MIDVTFREMLPQEDILSLVSGEMAELGPFTDPPKCRVVIQAAGDAFFDASVVIGSRGSERVRTEARSSRPDAAVRSAFAQLRARVVGEGERVAALH